MKNNFYAKAFIFLVPAEYFIIIIIIIIITNHAYLSSLYRITEIITETIEKKEKMGFAGWWEKKWQRPKYT